MHKKIILLSLGLSLSGIVIAEDASVTAPTVGDTGDIMARPLTPPSLTVDEKEIPVMAPELNSEVMLPSMQTAPVQVIPSPDPVLVPIPVTEPMPAPVMAVPVAPPIPTLDPAPVLVEPVPPSVPAPAPAPVLAPQSKAASSMAVPIAKPISVTPQEISPNAAPIKSRKEIPHANKISKDKKCKADGISLPIIKPVCKDPWKVTIAPYVWGMNMNGTVNVGAAGVRIKEGFNDILQDFKGGGMLYLEVDRGKWGVFLNSMYAYLDRTVSSGTVTVKPVVKYGLFTIGASYNAYSKVFRNCTSFILDPYIGARYTINDTSIRVTQPSGTVEYSNNQQWVDPIVGARATYIMNKRWSAVFAGDVGGVDYNQNSYNVSGFIGYAPVNKCVNLTLYAGYRLLYQKYVNDYEIPGYSWKMHLFGPIAGVAFVF